jgi:hypothetical protein
MCKGHARAKGHASHTDTPCAVLRTMRAGIHQTQDIIRHTSSTRARHWHHSIAHTSAPSRIHRRRSAVDVALKPCCARPRLHTHAHRDLGYTRAKHISWYMPGHSTARASLACARRAQRHEQRTHHRMPAAPQQTQRRAQNDCAHTYHHHTLALDIWPLGYWRRATVIALPQC